LLLVPTDRRIDVETTVAHGGRLDQIFEHIGALDGLLPLQPQAALLLLGQLKLVLSAFLQIPGKSLISAAS
jgi:hypothetical protein